MRPVAALVAVVLILAHLSVARADECSGRQGCASCTNDTQCAYCPDIQKCYPYGVPECASPVYYNQTACPEVFVDCTKHVSCTGCLSSSSLGRCQWCVATQYCDAVGTTASTCDTGWTTSCNIFNKDLLIGSCIVFMGGVIGSGGGMGGGGLYLPVFLLVLRLSAHVAIPLSKFTIFGVAVGGYVITHAQRHPSQNRPLIDYDTSLILEPMTLAGSIFGVYMNVIFPAYLIIVFLVVLLTFTAKRTIDKGFQLHREELEAARQLESVVSAASPVIAPTPGPAGRTPVTLGRPKARAPMRSSSRGSRSRSPSTGSATEEDGALEPQDDTNDRLPLLGSDDAVPNYSSNASTPVPPEKSDSVPPHESIPVLSEHASTDTKPQYSPEVLAQLEKDKKTPYIKIFYLWFVLGVTLIFQMLKGNGQTESVADINCGTGGFWATLLAPVPFLWFSSYLFGKQLEREYAYKVSIGYPFVKGDVRWVNDPNVSWWRRPLVSFPIYSTVAGVAAGFLGIGGGMVKGPLMMEMGILSSVAVATSAYMIVFTATSTAGQFLILGRIAWEMALWYTAVGFCAAMVGQYGMVWMVKKYKKQSYVNFFLGGAIVVSVIAMVVTFGFQMKEDVDSGQNLSFHGVCGKPGD